MKKETVSRIMLVLLLISAFSIQRLEVSSSLHKNDTDSDYVTVEREEQQETSIFVVGIPGGPKSYFDMVGLVSAVAASVKNHGKPFVLFSFDCENGGEVDPLSESFVQLIESLKPNFTYVIGNSDFNPTLNDSIFLRNNDPFALCLDIVENLWNESDQVVVSNFGNFTEAIQAVPVASSLNAPLLFYFPDAVPQGTLELLNQLAVTEVVLVGQPSSLILGQLNSYNQTILRSPFEVAAFLGDVASQPNYTILVNVADRDNPEVLVPKISLVSSVLAAYRNAAIYPMNTTPMIPKIFEFQETAPPPPGINSTSQAWIGNLTIINQSHPVAVYALEFPDDPEMVNIDLNQNGIYNDTGEGPYYTGEEVRIGERNFTIDVRTLWWTTPRRVSQLWCHYPSSQSIKRQLSKFYQETNVTQRFLTLAGHWDVLPFDYIDVPGTGQLSLASTSIQSQTTENPYLDLAIGRITANTFTGASLCLFKTVLCEQDFLDAAWKRNVLLMRSDAGITDAQAQTLSAMFRNHPYFNLTLYLLNNITHTTFQSNSTDKSLVYVGGHGSYAGISAAGLGYYQIPYFGEASPFFFLDGCDTGGIDLPENQNRSVALQLVEHGALGVIAPTRHSSDFPNIHVMVSCVIHKPAGAALKSSRNFGVHWSTEDIGPAGRPIGGYPSSYRNFVIHELIGDPAVTLFPIEIENDMAVIMREGVDVFDDVLALGYVPDVYGEWNIGELWNNLNKYKVVLRENMIDASGVILNSISQNLEQIYSWIGNGGSWLTDTFITGSLAVAELECHDFNGPTATIANPSHPIFNIPNKLNSSYFSGWSPWVADAIIDGGSDLPYYNVLVESSEYPVLLERQIDKGRILISGLAAGRSNMGEFIENLITHLARTLPQPHVFDIEYNNEPFEVTVLTNSTILGFNFNESLREINIDISGPEGTIGVCNITIPNGLIQDLWSGSCTILIDGLPPLYEAPPLTNGTHTFLYFRYVLSTHEIIIVPEFPYLLVLPLFMIATLLTVIVRARVRNGR